jgi:diguanylate cyclase (GGDEF)-like protein
MVAELQKLNAGLESRVRGRTRELSAANRKLKRALQENERKNEALTLLNEALNIQATIDPLTGLLNRREFNKRLTVEWIRYRRHKRPLSLIMVDIDYFKKVNDNHGHGCGDIVLQELAKVMSQQQRRHDILCRFGGEEFVIVLPETGLDAAFSVAESLRLRVAEHLFRCGDTVVEVKISLGVAGTLEQKPIHEDDLIKLADLALYKAKEGGRNRSAVVDAKQRDAVARISR